MTSTNQFGARATLAGAAQPVVYYRLQALTDQGLADLARMPVTVKVLLENLLRHEGSPFVHADDIRHLAGWSPTATTVRSFSFLPARVLLQDYTGVPAVVDLAAMRDAVRELGADPRRVNPLVPAELVIDHSVQVDEFGTSLAFRTNIAREYERNLERYALLRWAQQAFDNFHVVPPDNGICHQVNLEFLAKVVQTRTVNGDLVAMPDTLVGTDSHTTMINGLGVLGWGVGGIEAEAVLLGQPLALLTPEVVGFEMTGRLREGVTATDLVLTVTEILRRHGVVEKFVEFCGAGLSQLSLPDRATIANMSPEYGATAGLFPVDDETLRYLRDTNRPRDLIDLVERYCKEQGLFRTAATPVPQFNTLLRLDLGTVEPSLAGPRRPEDRVPLSGMRASFRGGFADRLAKDQEPGLLQKAIAHLPGAGAAARAAGEEVEIAGEKAEVRHGSVVIAAITSCTNTSNPSVMVGAGLLAKKAVERGLRSAPFVKTSLAPGSAVVTEYLDRAGLTPYLEALGFHTVGYGCTTCIGNSGPLPPPVTKVVEDDDLVVAAVLSGNRNFEGRINALVRAAYLASPPLVVAFALAGSVDLDLTTEPLGTDRNGSPVYLRDIWPTQIEIAETIGATIDPQMYEHTYGNIFKGDERWQGLPVPAGDRFQWDPDSTYVRLPPYFEGIELEPTPRSDIRDARVLALLGNAVSTDHISPAGSIAANSPAARYLRQHEVEPADFNSYGARRGNHEVMMRGTFANIRLRNALAGGKEGNWTEFLPTGEQVSIYDASARYREAGTPLIVIAGQMYGNGSSRDWAAKGPMLQGVQAVIAESFERIHRSNLVGMGILPLVFKQGNSAASLGITGRETYDIDGIAAGLKPRQELTISARREDGTNFSFPVTVRIDSDTEMDYYRNGGILQMVLRNLVKGA